MRRCGNRAHDSRGVRQLGAQCHRVRIGWVRHRSVRRHSVRRGRRALFFAPSARGHAAAQIQNRLQRLQRRLRARCHQRPRLHRANSRRPKRVSRDVRGRLVELAGRCDRASRLRARCGSSARRRSDLAPLRRARKSHQPPARSPRNSSSKKWAKMHSVQIHGNSPWWTAKRAPICSSSTHRNASPRRRSSRAIAATAISRGAPIRSSIKNKMATQRCTFACRSATLHPRKCVF